MESFLTFGIVHKLLDRVVLILYALLAAGTGETVDLQEWNEHVNRTIGSRTFDRS